MSNSGVSIVILNFNGLEHLQNLFPSIDNLRFPNRSLELILVDNASTDGSLEWMEQKRPDVRIVRNKTNEVFASACNKGALAASNEWLAFVNNDMRLEPSWLETMLAAVDQAGDKTVCGGSRILSWDGNHIDFNGGITTFYGHSFQKDNGRPIAEVATDDRPQPTLFPCGGAMLIRKDVFLEAGGFDTDYSGYFEDVDLGWRLWLLGYEVVSVPSAIVYHKGFSTYGKFPGPVHLHLCERNALYTIYKNYSEENLSKILPAALLLMVQRALLHTTPYTLTIPGAGGDLSAAASGEKGTLAEMTLGSTLKRIKDLGLREAVMRADMSLAVRNLRRNSLYPIAEKGTSILSAFTAFAKNLDKLARSRARVQESRKRSDQEILPLFGEPFKAHPDTEEFRELTRIISRNFGIYKIFGGGA